MSGQLITQKEAYARVQTMLARVDIQQQIAGILPKHVTPEKLNNLLLVQFRKEPKLFTDCTRESLLGAVLESCQLGLEVGTLGHCWMVPFRNNKRNITEATLLVGYRGMLDLAWRSNKIKAVAAKCVYEGDEIDIMFGLNPQLDHVPWWQREQPTERGKFLLVYAIIETDLGGKMWEVMSADDVEAIRKRSRSGGKGPWTTDYEEMAKKTVLRRLLKLAPSSTELQRAVTLDEQGELGIPQGLGDAIDVTPPADDEVLEAPLVPEGAVND